ncbi:GntR family transcriptional regulator [Piscinibacter sp.]|uniref:GntR family transcriptional regulator n=1 Tax=Piscinibacter sp. TaxID=1903157 RepID=UPI0039E6CBC8
MLTLSPIARQVVQSILERKVRPGDRLGEQALADLFGVSRTLAREALMQLQARGFVEVRPRLGWFVVEPSFEDAQQTYQARRVIESGMLHEAGKPLQAALERLRAHVAEERRAIADADAATRSVLLADFHVCLAECLGNRFLISSMVDLSARTVLAAALYQSASEAQDSNDDHAAIVAALAAGDNEAAQRLMRAHIDALEARLDARLSGRASGRDRLRDALAPSSARSVQSA